jgi:amino acid transporter
MQLSSLFRKKTVESILAHANDGDGHNLGLNRVLTVRDLTFLGIAAVVGAGIFSTVGKACFDGGPGVILLFLITAIACGFSALCYADFASRIPVSGSAYTYSYAAFGEIIAWIIGWDLILEYAIGNIAVAISWSGNLTSFLDKIGLHIPDFLSTGYLAAETGHKAFLEAVRQHEHIAPSVTALNQVWLNAPHVAGIPIILNLPAFLITALITLVVYIGIKETRNSSNMMVVFKMLVIIAIIVIGFFYVKPINWDPFMPNGFSGVMKGVSAVFFAYIGFDAISTTAEECKNPQRDLPRGMFYSLIICTVLYILVALVLTGMVPYMHLGADDFLAHAFTERGLSVLGGIIAISAVIATTSVLLVFQLGQPRIWMSMSRDGLLPKRFSKIHPKFKTPSFSTIIAGLLVGVPALILDSNLVTDMTSIGTLFAFILVCGGILLLPRQLKTANKFRVPYIGSRLIMPALLIIGISLTLALNYPAVNDFYHFRTLKTPAELVEGLNPLQQQQLAESTGIRLAVSQDSLASHLATMDENRYRELARDLKVADEQKYDEGMEVFLSHLPFHIFVLLCLVITWFCIRRNLSLIPVLGLLCCSYLVTEMGITNWIRFFVWLIIGLIIYFSYGRKRSRLGKESLRA